MPVRKFRRVEDMEAPTWRRPGDPALYRTMNAVWDLGARMSRRVHPYGVTKYSSIEQMSQAQEKTAREPR